MGNFLKNGAILAGVLLLSTMIYFAVSDNQRIKEDVFNRSLQLLGQQLVSLLPDGQERGIVTAKWERLVDGVNKGEIPPEQVERVAVGILNASNLEKQLSVDDAEILINLAFESPEPASFETFEPMQQLPAIPKVEKQKLTKDDLHKRLQSLGKTLEAACAFNTKIKTSCEKDPVKRRVFVQNLRYDVENGIRLNVDMSLKHDLNSASFQTWKQELSKLEKERMVEWRQDFALEILHQHELIRSRLDSLRSALHAEHAQLMSGTIELDARKLAELQKLEKLQTWQVVGPVFVKNVSLESLKEVEGVLETIPKLPEEKK